MDLVTMRSVLIGILLTTATAQTTELERTQQFQTEVDGLTTGVQQLISLNNVTETLLSSLNVNQLNMEVQNTNSAVSATLPKAYNQGANEFNQIALSAIFNNKQVNNIGARINKLRDHAENHSTKVSFLSKQVSTTMANLQNAEEHFNFQISYLTDAMTDMNNWYNRAQIVCARQRSAIDYTGSLLNHLETTLTQTQDMMRGLADMLEEPSKTQFLTRINDINAQDLLEEVSASDNSVPTHVAAEAAPTTTR